MGSQPTSSHSRTASGWTPSGRRCSRSSPRRTGSTRPFPVSRRPPERLRPGLIRLTATSVTTVRKSSSWRLASMRPTTSSPRPTSPSRRIMLMEEEDKKAAEQLCATVTKLAMTSKAADNVLKTIKVVENTCLNNEVTIEELDKNLRATVKMASDNEQKLGELSRKLGVQEAELKRAVERAELAEAKLKGIEEELQMVGENMKQ